MQQSFNQIGHDGIWHITSPTGEILSCSQAVAEFSGFRSPKEFIGKHYCEQLSDAAEFSCDFTKQDQHVLNNKNNQSMHFIASYRYADGHYHCLLGEKSLYPSQNKNIKASYFDITNIISPFLLDMLSAHSQPSEVNLKKKAFWYQFDTQPDSGQSLFTHKEQLCLNLLIKGHSNKAIAQLTNCSVRTVESHVQNIKDKLGVTNRSEVLYTCISRRLLSQRDLFGYL